MDALFSFEQQMSWPLYCGSLWLCVGFRELAVVTGFCRLHPLLPPHQQMWLSGAFVCARWCSISKFGALGCSSAPLHLITVSRLLAQVWFGCFAVCGLHVIFMSSMSFAFGCIKMSTVYPQWLTLLVPTLEKTNKQGSSTRMMRFLPPAQAFQAQGSSTPPFHPNCAFLPVLAADSLLFPCFSGFIETMNEWNTHSLPVVLKIANGQLQCTHKCRLNESLGLVSNRTSTTTKIAIHLKRIKYPTVLKMQLCNC